MTATTSLDLRIDRDNEIVTDDHARFVLCFRVHRRFSFTGTNASTVGDHCFLFATKRKIARTNPQIFAQAFLAINNE
jgi:hypothetical protein